jgi:hypothetical protein
MSDLGVNDA